MFGDLIRTEDPPPGYQVPLSKKDYRSGHCEACKEFIFGGTTAYVETIKGGIAHEGCVAQFCKLCKTPLMNAICANESCLRKGKILTEEQIVYAAVLPALQSEDALKEVSEMLKRWGNCGLILQ